MDGRPTAIQAGSYLRNPCPVPLELMISIEIRKEELETNNLDIMNLKKIFVLVGSS
jgi:hypothetical protein